MNTTTQHNDGGPAFPGGTVSELTGHPIPSANSGMTLRDYFACHASDDDVSYWLRALGSQATREEAKYAHADAMLKAREVTE